MHSDITDKQYDSNEKRFVSMYPLDIYKFIKKDVNWTLIDPTIVEHNLDVALGQPIFTEKNRQDLLDSMPQRTMKSTFETYKGLFYQQLHYLDSVWNEYLKAAEEEFINKDERHFSRQEVEKKLQQITDFVNSCS